jgi:hypothetical protein
MGHAGLAMATYAQVTHGLSDRLGTGAAIGGRNRRGEMVGQSGSIRQPTGTLTNGGN